MASPRGGNLLPTLAVGLRTPLSLHQVRGDSPHSLPSLKKNLFMLEAHLTHVALPGRPWEPSFPSPQASAGAETDDSGWRNQSGSRRFHRKTLNPCATSPQSGGKAIPTSAWTPGYLKLLGGDQAGNNLENRMNGNEELCAAAAATSATGSGLSTWRLKEPASTSRSVCAPACGGCALRPGHSLAWGLRH